MLECILESRDHGFFMFLQVFSTLCSLNGFPNGRVKELDAELKEVSKYRNSNWTHPWALWRRGPGQKIDSSRSLTYSYGSIHHKDGSSWWPNPLRILPLILESACGRTASSSCFSASPSLHIHFYSQNSNQAFFPDLAFNDHRLIYKAIEKNNSVEPSVLMKEKSGAFAIMGNLPEPSPGYGY